MPIHFRNLLALDYKDLINEKFNYLREIFDFEPGEIFIKILTLEEFEKNYYKEYNSEPKPFVVGHASKNGRIFILKKEDFPKKNHKQEEFERVILHEIAHMFIRRILWPKKTYPWIEEGICEFLSFGDYPLKIKEIIDFNEIQDIKGWRKHHAYQQTREFFKRLSERFGNKKIAEFVKKIKQKSEKESFKEVFEQDLEEFQKKFISSLKNEKITSSRNSM